jgi:hypothetical protein
MIHARKLIPLGARSNHFTKSGRQRFAGRMTGRNLNPVILIWSIAADFAAFSFYLTTVA